MDGRWGSLPKRNSRKLVLTWSWLVVVALAATYSVDVALMWGAGGPSTATWGIESGTATLKEERVQVARSFGAEMDVRDRMDVIADLQRQQQVAAVPGIMIMDVLAAEGTVTSKGAQAGAELLPLGGIANTLTVLCNELGRFVTYHSDEHGFPILKGFGSCLASRSRRLASRMCRAIALSPAEPSSICCGRDFQPL